MNDENGMNERLIQELSELPQRVAERERLQPKGKPAREVPYQNEDHYRDLVENSHSICPECARDFTLNF